MYCANPRSIRKISLCILFLLPVLITSCQRKEKVSIFKKVDPSASKISFSNQLQETDSLNILDYLYFYNGAGLASADFNNDGLEDLYFISNQSSNKLYLNKGNLKFEDITEKAGVQGSGSWKTGVTVVDVNGDGYKDIYLSVVSGYKGFKGKNQLYINNGDLTFTESAAQWGVDFAGLSTQAAFFDYDKDGDLDLFILTHSVHSNDTYGDSTLRFKYSESAGDHLYRNEGSRFTDVTKSSGIYASPIGYGLGLSIGDLNNDGWDDIYVSNDFFEQDYYYLNQKDGTFKESLKDAFGHTSLFSMGNTLSDINKDGSLDILTTDMLPEDIVALKTSINDEALDIYNLEIKSGYYYQYSRNCLQLNVARGKKFVDIGLYSGLANTDWTWSPLIQDFDMDGRKDVFFANGIKKRLTDLDYLKYLGSKGVLNTSKDRSFDQDKISRMPDGRVHNYLYHADSLLRFTDISADNDMQDLSSSSGAIAVDLDNDGDLEIVTNNLDEKAYIYENTTRNKKSGDKARFLKYSVAYKSLNPDGIGTKLFLKSGKHVDHQEIQTTNAFQSNQSSSILFTMAPGDSATQLLVVWPDNSYQLIKNFKYNSSEIIRYHPNGGRLTEPVSFINSFISGVADFTSEEVGGKLIAQLKAFETPDFNYYSLLPHSYLPHSPPIAAGDLNGDGWDDLYVGGIAGEEKYLLLANGDGTFSKVTSPEFNKFLNYSDSYAKWCDLDKDGDLDLLVQSTNHPFANKEDVMPPRVYMNLGGFKFQYKELPKLATQTARSFLIDVNNDGLKDIFLTGTVSYRDYTKKQESYILLNRGSCEFDLAGSDYLNALTTIQFIKDIAVADIDKNGKADLVVAAEWQPLHILLNNGKSFSELKLDCLRDLKGWWQSVAVADLDHDGKADLLAGNWGLNSKFDVDEDHPLYLYNSDLDQDGKNDLILSAYHQGRYYPFRPKSDLEQELPYLKKEWLSYQKMADKTTDQIFKGRLNPDPLSANTFKSIFISDVLHAKSAQDLPYLYQQSPIMSFSTTADNSGEVFANGNFWGVIPYEGKYDALGIARIRYSRDGHTILNPQYFVNPAYNFQETPFMTVIKQGKVRRMLTLSGDGKLILLESSLLE